MYIAIFQFVKRVLQEIRSGSPLVRRPTASQLVLDANRIHHLQTAQPGCTGLNNSPKIDFKYEAEKHLTGKETEPWEIL